MIVEDDGVSGIVPARITRRVLERLGKIIHHLALTFVAPLRAHHTDCLRSQLLSHFRRPILHQAALCPLTFTTEALQAGQSGKQERTIVPFDRLPRKRDWLRRIELTYLAVAEA